MGGQDRTGEERTGEERGTRRGARGEGPRAWGGRLANRLGHTGLARAASGAQSKRDQSVKETDSQANPGAPEPGNRSIWV